MELSKELIEENPSLLNDDQIKSLLEQEAILGLEDAYHFNKYILGCKEMEEQPHRELCDFLYGGKDAKLIMLPRGSFKSTVVTVGFTLNNIVLDGNIRVLIASEKLSNAQKFLSEIKGHMEGNEYFRTLYGKLDEKKKDVTWNDSEIIVSTRTKNMKEPTISTAGIDVTKVGMHYDLIIVDDPVSQNNVGNKDQIDKVLEWWKLLLSLLEPNGRMIVIGTRWDYGDLYGTLQEEPYCQMFDFLIRGAEEVNEKGEVVYYFPTRLNEKFLLRQKQIQGTYIYSCQYLNQPVSKENQEFKEDWFKEYLPNDLKGVELNKFLCCDPAISMEKQADSTVFMVGGVDEKHNLYILLVDKGKYTPNQICDKFLDYAKRYDTCDNGLETVAFQKSLRYILNDKMREKGEFIKITELKSHTRDSKEMRIRALQPRYEMGTIFHKSGDPMTEELKYELLHFPKGKHDDIIDTEASLLEIMYAPTSKVKKHKSKKDSKKYRSKSMKW